MQQKVWGLVIAASLCVQGYFLLGYEFTGYFWAMAISSHICAEIRHLVSTGLEITDIAKCQRRYQGGPNNHGDLRNGSLYLQDLSTRRELHADQW